MSDTKTIEDEERRRAARVLLRTPVLTGPTHTEDLALVRKHEQSLRNLFSTRFGYQLNTDPRFARLAKTPLPDFAPPRPALTPTGRTFTPRTYAYLALAAAALMAPGTGEQVLISTLAEQVRADAVTAGVDFPETTDAARDLVRSLGVLAAWGVITEVEGTVAGWGREREEALLDVNQPLLAVLLAAPLRDLDEPGELLADRPRFGVEEPRRSLRRKLAENPVVPRTALTELEAAALSRERRELARVMDEDFGLVLEVRAEGALVYDPEEETSDIAFPGRGTVPHAALLLTNALVDVLDPHAGDLVRPDPGDPGGGLLVPGALATWAQVRDNVELLIEQYGTTFGAAYAADAGLLEGECVDLLVSLGLAARRSDGLWLSPACGRYRPEPQRAPARTRAMRRIDDEPLDFDDPDTDEHTDVAAGGEAADAAPIDDLARTHKEVQ